MYEVRRTKSPVDAGIFDPSKFRARYHRSKKNRIDIFHAFNKTSLTGERKAYGTAQSVFAQKM